MSFLKCLVILIIQLYYHFDLNIAQVPDFVFHQCGGNETDYSPNSEYDTNLNTLLSSLPQNLNSYGLYNASIGQNPDRVSVIAQCRGDVELKPCHDCINNAALKIQEVCPHKKVAFGYYDFCTLRYSNESIIGTPSSEVLIYIFSTANVSSPVEFMQDLRTLLERIRNQAMEEGNKRRFGSGNISAPDFTTHIFAYAQCSGDLSPQSCYNCLDSGYTSLPGAACYAKRSCHVFMLSCDFRYELNPFFSNLLPVEALPPLLPPPRPSPPLPPSILASEKGDKNARNAIIIGAATVTAVIIIVCISVILMRKRRKKKLADKIDTREGTVGDDISTVESLQFDLATIKVATDNFSNANKLGQGGFGPVYKGKLLNGHDVAVKRLSADSGQGDLEFKNEVLLVARLQHRNLVRLLGFCLDGTERLLVYEFVPNASLDHFLFDPVKRRQLDWGRRSKIIGGIAKGILYLHEDSRLRIIHRDLKASNVLLDSEMNPKIADFGMAKLFSLDETQGNTSRIVGTYGYMAPEYAMHGQFSVKSDVFSFGVLVLEILSGQRNTCFRNGESVEDLLSYAWSNWRERTTSNLIDPMLKESSGLVRDIVRCIHIALLCIQENVVDRPTMAAVVLMLSSLSLSLPLPCAPSYSMRSNIASPEISLIQEYNSRMSEYGDLAKSKSISSSRNEASITELYPR